MKRIITLLLLRSLLPTLAWPQIPLGYSGTGTATWSFIQKGFNDTDATCSATTTTCAVTMNQPVGANHILIVWVMIYDPGGSLHLNSISEESTSLPCSTCYVINSFFNLDVRYVLNTTGTESTVTCVYSAASMQYQSCMVAEFAYSGGAVSFDVGNSASNLSCGTTCASVSLSLIGAKDLIVHAAVSAGVNITAISSPYTNLCSGTCGNQGGGYLLNATSGSTAPNWTVSATADNLSAAIAIKPGGGGSWSVIQSKFNDNHGAGTGGGSCTVPGTTCNVTVSTIALHDVIIAFAIDYGSQTTLVSISGETSTDCTACDVTTTGDNSSIGVRYVLNATGGETSFTCTLGASSTYVSCGIIVLRWSGATPTYDTGGNVGMATCTTCTGPTLTLCGGSCTGTPDALVNIINPDLTGPSGGVSGTGWVDALNGSTCCSGMAAATKINTSSGAPASWPLSSGNAMLSGIALKGN
jgi:hypothetical protein